MAVCSYLVIPAEGATDAVMARLAALPGCETARAENREVILLVTDTEGPEQEEALRRQLESVEDILAMVFTFGEIDREAPPVQLGRGRSPRGAA
jgi:nitrate reductase NapAB chaperone NapD